MLLFVLWRSMTFLKLLFDDDLLIMTRLHAKLEKAYRSNWDWTFNTELITFHFSAAEDNGAESGVVVICSTANRACHVAIAHLTAVPSITRFLAEPDLGTVKRPPETSEAQQSSCTLTGWGMREVSLGSLNALSLFRNNSHKALQGLCSSWQTLSQTRSGVDKEPPWK